MKNCKIKPAFVEIVAFAVLMFSYPYIINIMLRIFRENINAENMIELHFSMLFSCGISIVFAIWTVLGIFLIRRISVKASNRLFIVLLLLIIYIAVPILCLNFMKVIETSVIVKWFQAALSDRTFFTTLII